MREVTGFSLVIKSFLVILTQGLPEVCKTRDQAKTQPLITLHVIHSFFYKNLFYKNIEAEIDPDFKNILRTYPS